MAQTTRIERARDGWKEFLQTKKKLFMKVDRERESVRVREQEERQKKCQYKAQT